jgi:hypothetical protein
LDWVAEEAATDFAADALADRDHVAYTAAAADTELVGVLAVQATVAEVGHQAQIGPVAVVVVVDSSVAAVGSEQVSVAIVWVCASVVDTEHVLGARSDGTVAVAAEPAPSAG